MTTGKRDFLAATLFHLAGGEGPMMAWLHDAHILFVENSDMFGHLIATEIDHGSPGVLIDLDFLYHQDDRNRVKGGPTIFKYPDSFSVFYRFKE